MAGAKPSEEEKAQIRDLAEKGYKVEEIQQRFPHIDGRSIAGIHVRATAKRLPPEIQASTLPLSGGGEALAAPPAPRTVTVASPVSDTGKTPQQIAAETLGFTPIAGTVHNPGGFTPMHREYFIVKKLDPPNEGVQKTEYPPFGITELYNRYPTGEYEIHHYREGRLFSTYRDKIVKPSDNQNLPTREIQIQRDPADLLLKGVDLFDRLNTRVADKNAQADAIRAQAEVAQVTAKAKVEETATVGLIKMLEKQYEPKPDTISLAIDKILAMMQQEKQNAEARHRQEMESLEKKQAAELERERLRLQAESERLKADLASREKMQQEFLAKMAEVERARNDLAKETQTRMIEDIKAVQDAYKADFEEKKKFMEKQFEMQQRYTDEIIRIKRESGTGAESLRMAEIIKDGIVGGLDRVGARIDMLVDRGVIPGKVVAAPGIPMDENVAKVEGKAAEAAKEIATKDAIRDAVKEEWFQNLQDEIAITIDRRKKAANPALKPHGSILGQAFIDRMNKEPRIRTYFHYLCTRYWSQLMEDVAEGIKPENKELFADPEAEQWFIEFQAFLTASWNASIGVGRK